MAARCYSVGFTLVLVSLGLWAFTFAWFWLPKFFLGAEGQLYALFPIALVNEAVAVILALLAAVFAVVDTARRRISAGQTVFILVASVSMLTVGPLLLWFGMPTI